MGAEHRGRPRGNLLPKPTPPEPEKPCVRFIMDVDHYRKTGEVIPLTDPEEYKAPQE